MNNMPKTVADAVNVLLGELSVDDKERIGAMSESEIINMYYGLGTLIRDRFGLGNGNAPLLAATHTANAQDASVVLLRALWSRLQETS